MPSTRVVSVKLRAEMDQYKREMAQAAAATDRLGASGAKTGMTMSSAFKTVATSAAALGVAKLVKDSVELEAAYSKTMRQVAVQTKAPKAALQDLDDLAMKLGADTVFSAQDAASAMLELAKGGLSTAQIEAGALKNSLTLAAAGGLELGDAANSVVNTMGAFGLSAKDTGSAVAALAGAANASSADVSDITQALAQAGTSAKAAGLSVQETTAILAAFSNAGIQGSDAGTSLRTMLSRLTPQTKQQAAEMERLGLSFTKSNGEFVSGEEIAGRLQQAYKGMSAAERTASLQKVFGADAQRAANVLIEQGSKGIASLTKETSNLNAAQELADASMQGTSGALEQLDGAIETAKIQIGKGLAPVISDIAGDMSNWLETADVESWANDAGRGVQDFIAEITPLLSSLFDLGREALPAVASAGGAVVDTLEVAADVVKPFVEAFNALPDSAQKALVLAAGAQALNSKFDIASRLSYTAGEGLLTFGRNAEQAGERSGKATSGVGSLASSLKGFGVLAAVAGGFENFSKQVSGFEQLIGPSLTDKSSLWASTLQKDGKATAETAQVLAQSLSSSALGDAASSAGIDITRLADSLAKSGREGEYAQVVFKRLQDQINTRDNILGGAPFVDTDSEKATKALRALKDYADELDRAGEKARSQAEAQRESTNAFVISAYGLEAYKGELMGLPTEVLTRVLTPGAIKSAADMESLVRKYNLTPDLVRTLVRTSGVDLSAAELARIIDLAERIDRKKARAAVRAATAAADDALRATLSLLRSFKDRTVKLTVKQTIERQYTGKGDASGLSLAEMLSGGPRYMGGTVPTGFAGGGIVPGSPPSNPMVDNVIARGQSSGKIMTVRSGEWIINQGQSKKNDKWLAAINGGLNLDDLFGDVPGFASGGQVDAVSPLELTQLRIRVRDLRRSLSQREKYGPKKKRRTRYVLRGLDRVEAKQELAEANKELSGALRANRDAKAAGLSPEAYNDQQERIRQAREDRKSAAASATDSFIDNAGGLGTFSTPAAVERALERSITDMATLTSLLIQLKKKGASPWLLEQFMKAGPSRGTIRLAKRYLDDDAALRSVNAQTEQLTAVGNLYGQVTTDPKFLAAGSWSPALTAQQSRTLDVNVSTTDPTLQARETARVLGHELESMAAGAGI